MNSKLILTGTAAACCAALAVSAPAASAATDAVSENWAGYEVTNGSSDFSAASGSWVQPTARCTPGSPTYSAFWVGLGGGGANSKALEQTGTQSDCTASGSTKYYAWYELVPKAPVQLSLQVHAGDRMYARVAVNGSTVNLTLANKTTGASVHKTLQMSSPDTSTAEWVAEAPSQCTSGMQSCTPLALSDFGTVKFTNAYATSNGQTGSISHWDADAISLAPSSSADYASYGYGGYGSGTTDGTPANSAAAQPSSLSSDGSYFTVAYQGQGGSSVSTSGSPGYGSSGSGSGGASGYGNSGYPGDPYGNGYGYSGYPAVGYGPDGYGVYWVYYIQRSR